MPLLHVAITHLHRVIIISLMGEAHGCAWWHIAMHQRYQLLRSLHWRYRATPNIHSSDVTLDPR